MITDDIVLIIVGFTGTVLFIRAFLRRLDRPGHKVIDGLTLACLLIFAYVLVYGIWQVASQ